MTFRPDPRKPWHQYFLDGAEWASSRADCTRSKVGAVIVDRDHHVVATGYNGAPSGGRSCLAGECPRGRMSLDQVPAGSSYDSGSGSCIALHAEQNAVMYCSREQRRGGTIYITRAPCAGCLRMLSGSGLDYAIYRNEDGALVQVDLGEVKRGRTNGTLVRA